MTGPIVVCYSQHDRAYVEALVAHLRQRGVAVWHDQRLLPGEPFDPVVQQAIDAAAVVLVVSTAASAVSGGVGQQLQYAVSRGKPLAALALDPGSPLPMLAWAHSVNLHGGQLPGDDLVRWLHQMSQWAASAGVTPPPARRAALPWVLAGAAVVVVLAVAAVGVAALFLSPDTTEEPRTWQERAAAIPGIVTYLDPASPAYDETLTTPPGHRDGVISYPVVPPVGGPHNAYWQNCMGDVYPSEIAEEHAVHSLEHGAVWITYRPDLPPDQIATLASKVDGREFIMMSPYPSLDAPISLQAWGYQLKVDNADDGRVDDFITALRRNATRESMAGCSGGITDASPIPFDS